MLVYIRLCHKIGTVKTGTALHEPAIRHDHSHSNPAPGIFGVGVSQLGALLCWLATALDFNGLTYETCQICLMVLCWCPMNPLSWLLDQLFELAALNTISCVADFTGVYF